MSVSTQQTHPSGDVRGPQADEAPIPVKANLAPGSIEVVSNVAEDSVIGGVMDIASGVNTVALFANPFAAGAEEMLYVDERGDLRWARHVNPGAEASTVDGWSIDVVASGVAEVVVAVHPSGSVWAFGLITGDGSQGRLVAWELVADPAVLGGLSWAHRAALLPGSSVLSGLQVQYCADRASTPVVFVTDPAEPRLFWFTPTFPAAGTDPGLDWHLGGQLAYDPADRGVSVVAGVDSPVEEFSQRAVVSAVRIWTVVDGGLFLTSYFPRSGDGYARVQIGHNRWTGLVGLWSRNPSPGVVVASAGFDAGVSFGLATAEVTGAVPTVSLDQPLGDVQLWQDQAGLLHLYGRDANADLRVVHQIGWVEDTDAPPGAVKPTWDAHLNSLGTTVATTRGLVSQVATYALDGFPDELPSQHVMHQGVPAGQACAIYTQSTRTNFWCTEQVRLIPETLPAPYLVRRYQTVLTVKDGYGSPMGGVQVSLTADSPVDLEVGGRFYRTGSVTPAVLTTDPTGRITLRVVASGLSVPALYATIPGLGPAVTIQMAAEVHKFLGGNATLPNHTDGFTPTTVQAAQKPDGDPLFPTIKPAGAADDSADATWPPSAEEVVAWCAGAFAMDTGADLPTHMTAGLAEGEQVLGFTLQTHDPTRRGGEGYTTAEQLAARDQALQAVGGVWGELEDWVGDVWQGIRTELTAVGEVFINVADRAIELVITLADGMIQRLTALWDDILTAAHAIEGAFVALGAAIADAIAWLAWAFDFKDALVTAKHLHDAVEQLPRLLTPVLEDFQSLAHNWFIQQETTVKEVLDGAKASLTGRSVDSFNSPLATGSTSTKLPATGDFGEQAQGPHTNWFTDKVSSTESQTAVLAIAGSPELTDIIDELLEILSSASEWAELEAAVDDVGKLFSNLFDGADPRTIAAQELATLIDLLEHLILAALKYCDDVVGHLLQWGIDHAEDIVKLIDTPLTGVPLLDLLWAFVLAQAGLDRADYPFTVGMVGMFFAAYPLTLIHKMITGETPFPHGVPMPPALGDHDDQQDGYSADDIDAMLRVQLACGIIQTIDLAWDSRLNWECLRSVEEVFAPPAPLTTTASPFHLFAYGIGTFPWFYGYPLTITSDTSLAYARWAAHALFRVVDQGFVIGSGMSIQRFLGGASWPLGLPVTTSVTSLFGLFRFVLAAVPGPGPLSSWDIRQMCIEMAACLPTLTAFMRLLADRDVVVGPNAKILLGAKEVIDALADLFAGIATTAQAAYELEHPPKIVFTWPGIRLTDATVGVAYVSQQIKVDGGMEEFTWQVGAGDALPAGLSLALDDTTRKVTIQGTPEGGAAVYQFNLDVRDSFRPRGYDKVSCTLFVKES